MQSPLKLGILKVKCGTLFDECEGQTQTFACSMAAMDGYVVGMVIQWEWVAW